MQQRPPICVDSSEMTPRLTLLYSVLLSALLAAFSGRAWANPDAPTGPTDPSPKLEQAAPNPQTPADPLQRRLAEIGQRTAKIHAGEAIRSKESTARQSLRRSELSSLRDQLNVALSLPPASEERTNQIDQTWSSLRNLVQRLQDDRVQAIDALRLAIADRELINPESVAPYKSNAEIQKAMDGFSSALDARVSAVETEIDGTSRLLSDTRTLRRQARTHASDTAIQAVQDQHFDEIQAEMSAIPIDIRSTLRQTIRSWWKNPSGLSHVQALGELFLGMMELAFLLFIGMWVHSQTPAWIRRLMAHLEPENGGESWEQPLRFPRWMIPGDLRSLSPLLSALLQDVVVLTVSLCVYSWLHTAIPLIAWMAVVFASGACVRGAQGLVELALVTSTDNRPGLRVTDPEVRKGILWLVQYFGMLAAIHVVVIHLLINILGADRIADLFSDSIGIVNWIVLVVAFMRWGDLLRTRVRAGGTDSALAVWVVKTEASQPKGLLSAIVAAGLLLVRFVGTVLHQVIDSRGGLAWLGSFLARRQLRDTTDHGQKPLPASVKRSIGTGALRGLAFDQEVRQIEQRYGQWKQDPRRGLLAITGDRGVGKGVLMGLLADSFGDEATMANTPIDHTQAPQSLQWLASVAGIENATNVEELVVALKKQPPRVYLLSNLHRLFLRAVGHYEGLDAVLEVIQATGRHHFWVASLHGPAWSFLYGMCDVGHVNIFPSRIHLGRLSPADLSQWLLSQTRRGGVEPQFDSLLQRPVRGPDRIRMLERAERAYWRLLTDASQGNPSVAIRLWMDGLRPVSPDGPAHVGLFKVHDSEELEELTDDELFALTALILHEDLTVHELHKVLNQPEASVRALCRGLEQRTIITETESGRYKVRLHWLPAVERHLRRRSFMHKS